MAMVKKLTTESPVLARYDQHSELAVDCDAGERGLGAALIQKGKRIAQKLDMFTLRKNVWPHCSRWNVSISILSGEETIEHNDQKPLEMIVKKPLHKAPRRLQGMLLRMLRYDTDVIYHKGNV